MLAGMGPIPFSMQFRGHATWLRPGVIVARATAPSSALVTEIGAFGVHGQVEARDGAEAHLECRLTFADDRRYAEVGTISFGNGNALRFRSRADGTLGTSPDPHLRQGATVWEIDGGSGTLAGASGLIVSNFLLSDTGDLTDHQLGLVFLDDAARAEGLHP
jgi:hypothetical protein